jgi:type IV pilus assembly protein PilA
MNKQSNKGFTLIEIIIVVVILGVLAAIALPKLTAQVSKARAAEAFNVLGTLMGKISECVSLEESLTANCNTLANLTTSTGFTAPSSTNFAYDIPAATCAVGATACSATATPKPGKFSTAGSLITFSIDLGTGVITKTLVGDYSGLNK